MVQEYLTKNGITVLPQSPCSSELTRQLIPIPKNESLLNCTLVPINKKDERCYNSGIWKDYM
jgi:hypothetical protein